MMSYKYHLAIPASPYLYKHSYIHRCVNSTSNTVIIKPSQIVATDIQVDSVDMLPDCELDDDKSIPSTESVFSCVKRKDEFLYHCIVSDEAMDAEDKRV